MVVPARRHDGLVALIAERVAAEGPLPFAEVMELALYHPELGFYVAEGEAGRRGDFITSPEVGPLFGRCLARYLDRVWDRLGRPPEFPVVEHGAGPGTLARAVLAARPECSDALRYITVERSQRQRRRHPTGVEALAEPPTGVSTGVVVANELIDNLPVDIYRRATEGWERWMVGVDTRGELVETTIAAGPETMVRLDKWAGSVGRGAVVPDLRVARQWLADRVLELESGSILVLDYVSTTGDLARRTPVEWLRTYRGHERGVGVLDALGEQDITVEVALDQLAEIAAPSNVVTQADWLRELGIDELVDEGRQIWGERSAVGDLAALTGRSRVREAEALTDPDGLGGFLVAEWIRG